MVVRQALHLVFIESAENLLFQNASLAKDSVLGPSAACAFFGVEIGTFFLKFLTVFAVSYLATVLLIHAFGVETIVLVEEAHVGVEHHLPSFFLIG